MYHDDDDDDEEEEDFDEEEDEYVYKRDAAPKAAAFDDLMRAAVVHHAPAAEQLSVKQAEASSKLSQAFLLEVTEIKSISGVTATLLPTGATITIPGVPKNFSSPALVVRAEVSDDYPKTALQIDLLPPKDLVFQEVRLLPRLTQAIIARCSGKPALVETVKALHQWFRDPSIQEQLAEEDAFEESERREAQEREMMAEERKLEEIRERTALGLLPVWQPLTAAEESQRSPITASAPCKIVTDLDLPNANFVTAARVGGKVYFYGGTIGNSNWSDALHVLHIASRRVEEHKRAPKVNWPPRLTGHASCAIGHMVYVFGGKGADTQGYRSSTTLVLRQTVWELNTRTIRSFRLRGVCVCVLL